MHRKKVDTEYVKLKRMLTESEEYANEAYYTLGAIAGVVANKQKLGKKYDPNKIAGKKLHLTPEENYHYLTEQYGRIIHTFNEGKDKNSQLEKAIKIGKYIHRYFNGIKHFRKEIKAQKALPQNKIQNTLKLFPKDSQHFAAAELEGLKHRVARITIGKKEFTDNK